MKKTIKYVSLIAVLVLSLVSSVTAMAEDRKGTSGRFLLTARRWKAISRLLIWVMRLILCSRETRWSLQSQLKIRLTARQTGI